MVTSINKYMLIMDSLLRAYKLNLEVDPRSVSSVYNIPLKEANNIVNNFNLTMKGN